jgi:hypothetical protein
MISLNWGRRSISFTYLFELHTKKARSHQHSSWRQWMPRSKSFCGIAPHRKCWKIDEKAEAVETTLGMEPPRVCEVNHRLLDVSPN